jgi:hypothetical protein
MKKVFINIKFLFLTFLSATVFSNNSTAMNCAVPVCDISAKISELRSSAQGVRFEFLSNLFAATKNVEDRASLINLREFGIAAYHLTKEVDTEEWMFTAASQIANRSTEKLISAPPVKSDVLIKYYKSFIGDSQPSSFTALTHWNNILNKNQITNQEELSELIEFAKEAREISTKLNHEVYVMNLATAIITTASNQFLQLDPYIEGVYIVKTECVGNSTSTQCAKFDLITIMLTNDSSGIAVRFSEQNNTPQNSSNYQFMNSEFVSGRILQSNLDFKNNQNAYFSLSIDPVTKNIKGTFINSDYASEVRFSGKMMFNTQKIYSTKNNTLIKQKDLVRIFKGELALKADPHHKVSTIIQSVNDKLIATAQSSSLKIQFDSCHYLASKNIITLLSTSQGKFIKFTLKAVMNKKGQITLEGSGFSFANSTNYNITLTQAN